MDLPGKPVRLVQLEKQDLREHQDREVHQELQDSKEREVKVA